MIAPTWHNIYSALKVSPTAEIAAWDANGVWYVFSQEEIDCGLEDGPFISKTEVMGWASPAEVAAFLNLIAAI